MEIVKLYKSGERSNSQQCQRTRHTEDDKQGKSDCTTIEITVED